VGMSLRALLSPSSFSLGSTLLPGRREPADGLLIGVMSNRLISTQRPPSVTGRPCLNSFTRLLLASSEDAFCHDSKQKRHDHSYIRDHVGTLLRTVFGATSARSFLGERILARTPRRRRTTCGAEHVDEGAQAGRNLPVPRVKDEESLERRRPILQRSDQ